MLFRKSCRLEDNFEKYGRFRHATDFTIIRRERFARWITITTLTLRICNTYSFARQQCLREHASTLRYIASLFRHVRKIAKSKYELRHVRLVYPHGTTWLPLDGL